MALIIKIAWRNIWRHKGKSLVIGMILIVGACIMTIGAGVISGMNVGLQKNIVNGFTGDIVIIPGTSRTDNVFLDMMGKSVDPLPDYEKVQEVLASSPMIEKHLPIGKNTAMVLNEAGGSMDGAFIIGVDFEEYNRMFPGNLELVQGSFVKPGERGVLMTTGAQELLTTSMGIFFMPESVAVDTSVMPEKVKKIKDDLTLKRTMVFMGLSSDNTSTDVRLPIRGLVKYNALNKIWGMFMLMDIESYRQCMGYVSAAHQQMKVPESSKKLLEIEEDDLESMFSQGGLIVDSDREMEELEVDTSTQGQDSTQSRQEAGTYNLVLTKLKDGNQQKEVCDSLNSIFDGRDINVRAVTWQKATGTIGSMAGLIKLSLFIFVMLLFFVAIIIIINTLTMAAMERTPEIGMMRAIGAGKGFISSMFVNETVFLSISFGALGIVAGGIIVAILRAFRFSTDNDMLQLLYGGNTFQPFLSIADIFLVIIQLALVSVLAMIYPVFVARRITPLDAISRE
ncbi:MAG: FtsX-like permease family protein [Chitinivibrionales bacterium]|nr:FtsX-like permease family protein [Chitinivibrionales bacterium]